MHYKRIFMYVFTYIHASIETCRFAVPYIIQALFLHYTPPLSALLDMRMIGRTTLLHSIVLEGRE